VPLWTAQAPGLFDGLPVVVNDTAIVAESFNLNVHAYNANTGARVWTVPQTLILGDGRWPETSAAVGDGLLVLPSAYQLRAYRIGPAQ
jgi:hypothetical protein